MKTKILGLDISSSTIGVSLIEQNDKNLKLKLLHYEYYKPPKEGSIFERLSAIKSYILEILSKHKPDEVVIEDYIQFMSGGSGAKTIQLLAIINRTVGLTVYEKIGKVPHLLGVPTIRKLIKPEGYEGKVGKEEVPEIVAEILGIKFPWEYNKKARAIIENYDIADGIAVGIAWTKFRREQMIKDIVE